MRVSGPEFICDLCPKCAKDKSDEARFAKFKAHMYKTIEGGDNIERTESEIQEGDHIKAQILAEKERTAREVSQRKQRDYEIRRFRAEFKEKYRCPSCGKVVKFWPYVMAGKCPHCNGSLLKELMNAGHLSLKCQNCESPITFFTYVCGNCHKCGKPHRNDFRGDAERELKDYLQYEVYWVKCKKCGKKIEDRNLRYDEQFLHAGYCSRCGVICWSCATVMYSSGILEANEYRQVARVGNAIALQDSHGSVVSPKCPSCDKLLIPIVYQKSDPAFSLINVRKVDPKRERWQLW
jgi:hypothetical protein